MFRRYLLAFLIGWAFNYALDVDLVTRSTARWLEHGWLAAFYDTGSSGRRP